VTRPRRLTTVATEPLLVPASGSQASDSQAPEGPDTAAEPASDDAPPPEEDLVGADALVDDQPAVTPRRVATLR
ncbi:MAG TPA: hypothetical protein PLM52_17805, partial [Tabrizicola sp.]|nr:hypothetical protein [Tabrizicola sp.]